MRCVKAPIAELGLAKSIPTTSIHDKGSLHLFAAYPRRKKRNLMAGCPSWMRSQEGRTPVHVAAEQGWGELIDLLVRELKNKARV